METRATAAAAQALFQRMMRAAREQARLTVRPLGRIGQGAPGALRSAALVVVLLAGVLAQLAPVLVTAPVAHANPASPVSPAANAETAGSSVAAPVAPQPNAPKSSAASAAVAAGGPVAIDRAHPVSMQPGTLALIAGQAAHFSGSDGILAVDVPASAVTAAGMTAAGGALSLRITQVEGPSGSVAGGSGQVTFGTYVVQVVDATGAIAVTGLSAPLTYTLHLPGKFGALDLSAVSANFNGPLPVWAGAQLAPVGIGPNISGSAPAGVQRAASGGAAPGGIAGGSSGAGGPSLGAFGPATSVVATFDPQRHALVVTAPGADPPVAAPGRQAGVIGANGIQPSSATGGAPSTAITWNTQAAIASFGKPDPFNVDLSGGGLNAEVPIAVPAGPGGLTPPIHLTYSSASVGEQHSPQSPAGAFGEGWNLSLGSISWSEKFNIDSCTTASCANGGINWESVWQISDPFGTSAQLIPPDINYSTYWDDTPWYPCDTGTTGKTATHACPVIWQTAPQTHAKVVMYKSGITLPYAGGAPAPCWRVYLPSGIMEEFGCTADSLAYYLGGNNADYVSAWNLDLITDLSGNQIHITYYQDVQSKTVPGTSTTTTYIRDTQLQSIEWDSPTCLSAQTACTAGGTAPNKWAPLMEVSFDVRRTPIHNPLYVTSMPCNPDPNLRCDDPLSLTGSGGVGIPDVYTTYLVNDIFVNVRSSGSGTWNRLRDYQMTYEESGPQTITDPVSGKQESAAGLHLLLTVTRVGSDGTTAPPLNFRYGNIKPEYYEDDLHSPATAAGCGAGLGAGLQRSGQRRALPVVEPDVVEQQLLHQRLLQRHGAARALHLAIGAQQHAWRAERAERGGPVLLHEPSQRRPVQRGG